MQIDDYATDGVTGHGQIDAQHRVLHALLLAALRPGDGSRVETSVETRLHALSEFARKHFALEEVEMHRLGYPDAKEHGVAHSDALSELAQITETAAREGLAAQASIGPRLQQWFSSHMADNDLALSLWMRSSE